MGTTDEYLTHYGTSPGYYWNESIEIDYITWFNSYLAKASPPIAINHLTEDNMCNGVAIGLLLETLGNIKLNGLLLQPITRVERLHNVHEVFAVLRRLNIRLDNMQPEDVMNGNKDSIIQLLVAISSYFMLDPRARQMPHFEDGSKRSGSISPRAASRPTSTDRSTPSAHFTEILDSSYSHQIIGPTVYSGEQSGHSSPRSRSTMTVMFSGKRSPTVTKRSPSRPSTPSPKATTRDHRAFKYNTTPSPLPIYPPVQPPVHLAPPAQHNLRSLNQSNPELPSYVDPMNELSKLKTQLNTIQLLGGSRLGLITGEDSHSSRSTTVSYHTTKGVQTDDNSFTETEKELNNAKQQIIELTRMLQAKDVVLRKTEQENIRLNETVRRLRDVTRQKTASEQSANRSYPSASSDNVRVYTSNTHLNVSNQKSGSRGESLRFQSEHSYDPRLNAFQGFKQAPYVTQPITASYPDKEPDGDFRPSFRPEPRRARAKNDNIHVKKVSLNLDVTPGPAYVDHSIAPF